MPDLDYPALRALAAIVQTGSFARAARLLHLSPSAVSQRIRALEERWGTVLVVRGNPCTATEAGAWLCRHVENVGILEEELLAHLPGLGAREEPEQRVTLHIATNADSLGSWFLGAIAAFSRSSRYLVSVAVDDEDHTADWLEAGRVIAAVTSSATSVPGCRRIALGTMRYHAVASPDYRDRHFAGEVSAEAIGRAPALTFNQKDRLQHRWLLKALGREVAHPTHWLPSTQGFLDATLAGMGWSLNPALLVRDPLADGRLVELKPGVTLDVPLYWQINRLAAERLTGLTRAVVDTARSLLVPAA